MGKSFGRKTVLKAASFHAVPGRVTALMGRNGAGKTTLFRIAVGRVRPEQGRVSFRGRALARPTLAALAREGLLYASQETALTRFFTVGDHLEAMARAFGGAERVEETVELMRLGPFLTRRPGRISEGERQRTVLALALVRTPACVLLDEPFAGTAPRDRPLVAEAIGRLREGGAAIAISGHDVDDIFGVSDEIIWVTAGTSHWIGAPAEALTHDQFRREYLGPGRGRSPSSGLGSSSSSSSGRAGAGGT